MSGEPKYDDCASTDSSLRAETLWTTLIIVAVTAAIYCAMNYWGASWI